MERPGVGRIDHIDTVTYSFAFVVLFLALEIVRFPIDVPVWTIRIMAVFLPIEPKRAFAVTIPAEEPPIFQVISVPVCVAHTGDPFPELMGFMQRLNLPV